MDRRVLVAALLVLATDAGAGSLEPPPGPISPTMKPLQEVEARTPIRQADLPLSITADGAYYLAENLNANVNGGDMITVSATHASIDLNGFTIHGTSQVAQASDCIQVEPTVRSFHLGNGVIRACGLNGVTTNGATDMSVTLERLHVLENGANGITLGTGAYGVISECVARGNGQRGVLLDKGIIEDTMAMDNGSVGLTLQNGLIRGCMARANVVFNAIVLSGGLMADTYSPAIP
jgi:hypothetical protein